MWQSTVVFRAFRENLFQTTRTKCSQGGMQAGRKQRGADVLRRWCRGAPQAQGSPTPRPERRTTNCNFDGFLSFSSDVAGGLSATGASTLERSGWTAFSSSAKAGEPWLLGIAGGTFLAPSPGQLISPSSRCSKVRRLTASSALSSDVSIWPSFPDLRYSEP